MPQVERLLFEARRYARRQKYTHALKIYEQILDVEPQHLEALIGKGGCHYKLRERDSAWLAWREALRVDPGNAKAREFLTRLERPAPERLGGRASGPKGPMARRLRAGLQSVPTGPVALRIALIAAILLFLAAPFVVRQALRRAERLQAETASSAVEGDLGRVAGR